MRALGLAVLLALLTVGPSGAATHIPKVTVVAHSPSLAYLMYPEFYRTVTDAAADTTYRSAIIQEAEAYWEKNGTQILALVSELSGIEWTEESFPLYLVEEAPVWGTPDPLVLPLQDWRRGDLVRNAGQGNMRGFVLAQILAQRLFMQVPADKQPAAFSHPLFQPGLATRENLASLVAYWTIANLVSEKAAQDVVTDSGLILENPALNILNHDFLPGWRLTASKPLTAWVEEEPRDSDRVKKSVGFLQSLGLPGVEGRRGGHRERTRLGLRTRRNADGEVEVMAVEPAKMAARAGLRPGDLLIRVGHVTVDGSRDVMNRLVAVLTNEKQIDLDVERDGVLSTHHMDMAWLDEGK